jgi:hypothetical protein
LREPWSLPNISEENILSELRELWRDRFQIICGVRR